eukprot:COSAG03_NODE_1982_length_3262_cov_27.853304_4_plen_55_part_00
MLFETRVVVVVVCVYVCVCVVVCVGEGSEGCQWKQVGELRHTGCQIRYQTVRLQ